MEMRYTLPLSFENVEILYGAKFSRGYGIWAKVHEQDDFEFDLDCVFDAANLTLYWVLNVFSYDVWSFSLIAQ